MINNELAIMIATNLMPLSFVSSYGFVRFMSKLEPNYSVCGSESIKRRLKLLSDGVSVKIRDQLIDVAFVACTADCWTSRTQTSYITLTLHTIDNSWTSKNFTLATTQMVESHTSQHLCEEMEQVLLSWGVINKVSAIVTDNAANAKNSVERCQNVSEKDGLTCAAHSLQLAINSALAQDDIKAVCKKASSIVCHFRHSGPASKLLAEKQIELGQKAQKLIQSVTTRWNSTFDMLERLLLNRTAICSIVRLISGTDWNLVEELVEVLKPLQMTTTVLCSDNDSPASMVRPLIWSIIRNHAIISPLDSTAIQKFKETLVNQLEERFQLVYDDFSKARARLICTFLDPRYKDLEDEEAFTRETVRRIVRSLLEGMQTFGENTMDRIENTANNAKNKKDVLAFLFKRVRPTNDLNEQIERYLAEPELPYDENPLAWWKEKEGKFPSIAKLAKQYLCIPASSTSSERNFSTAGNIVTAKRNCLLPKNVDMLVFLYQNRQFL